MAARNLVAQRLGIQEEIIHMRHNSIVYKHCRNVMCPSVDVQVAHIGKHLFDQSPFLTNSSVVL